MSALPKELMLLIIQFLHEEGYKQSAHRLESESGLICNVKFIEELVLKGEWDVLEKYLAGFISVNENRYSVKILFEIRKQRYIEALESKDRAKALEILNQDLKAFKSVNEELFKEMTQLLTIGNIRENTQLSKYTDNKAARKILIDELKKLIEANPDLHEKRQFPSVKNSRLRLLVNQSLNWQHQLCKNPKPSPEIITLFEDHVCVPTQAAHQSPAPVTNQLMGPMLRANFMQQSLQQAEAHNFLAPSRGQSSVNPHLTQHPMTGHMLLAVHNAGDSELASRRSRHLGMSEEIRNLPTSSVVRPTQSHISNIHHTDDLPKTVISVINQGSEVKTTHFHPEYQTLLLVGTKAGDMSIWEIGSRMRIAHRSFSIWNISSCSMALRASFTNERHVSVNRVMWSPDGLFLGVAYSKHIVHIYSYRVGHELQNHREIEAHVGNVSDFAFAVQNQKLIIITCGEDKTIKVWDIATGAVQHIFEGHNAPVSCICPHSKNNTQACDSFLFSSDIDGKIKAWLYDESVSKLDFETPGFNWTRFAYSTDGSRLFSCGSSKDRDSYLVEWNDNEGTVKESYYGLGKQHSGVVHFDTVKRFLAAGDEFSVKFWDMDNRLLLFSTNADGGLAASPCIRFSKDGMLLAVSTSDNGIKILANPEGLHHVRSIENHPETRRLASASTAKASTVVIALPSISSAGRNTTRADRRIPFPVMPVVNQDNQNMEDVRGKNTDEVEFLMIRRPKEITEPSELRSLRLPDSLLPVKVIRLIYTHSGSGILALAYNAVHKLWKWQTNEQNPTANATADVAPQLWQPTSGILMTNDIGEANLEEAVPTLALSKNNSYVMSASGGKVSLFNLTTFKTMTLFMPPPPASTCLAFHPNDNNILAIGMSDSSIHIYNVRVDAVSHKLNGHQKCVTGLAFAIDKKILVSSGADAQLCVWNTDTWEKVTSKFLKLPSRRTNNPQAEARVHFNPDQTHFMVVHETQIAVYDPLRLDSCMQWFPRPASGSISDAVYSCDGESIFVCVEDGSVSILTANLLNLKCRINYASYMPSKCGAIRVCPNAIAAHPSDPSQLALGLSDGGVYVLEPLKSDKQWGSDPSVETSAGPSTNPEMDQTPMA